MDENRMEPSGAGEKKLPVELRPLPWLIFGSRWLQLPLYLGLILAQVVYVVLFMKELWDLLTSAMTAPGGVPPLISQTENLVAEAKARAVEAQKRMISNTLAPNDRLPPPPPLSNNNNTSSKEERCVIIL